MEFKEFNNPEARDYDITSSLSNTDNNSSSNPYFDQLYDLIGILEDVTEDELQNKYGISMNEYLNPTEDTIKKISSAINSRHR